MLLAGPASAFMLHPCGPRPALRAAPARMSHPASMLLPASLSVQLAELTAAEWSKGGRGETPENPAELPAEVLVWGVGSLAFLSLVLVGVIVFKVRQAGLADAAVTEAIEGVTEAMAANEEKRR